MTEKHIFVYLNWPEDKPILVGRLHINRQRHEVFSFELDTEFLKQHGTLLLDPEIFPFEGRQYTDDGKLFGMFSDSSPDRWGRMLMQRREAIMAKAESSHASMTKDAWGTPLGNGGKWSFPLSGSYDGYAANGASAGTGSRLSVIVK